MKHKMKRSFTMLVVVKHLKNQSQCLSMQCLKTSSLSIS